MTSTVIYMKNQRSRIYTTQNNPVLPFAKLWGANYVSLCSADTIISFWGSIKPALQNLISPTPTCNQSAVMSTSCYSLLQILTDNPLCVRRIISADKSRSSGLCSDVTLKRRRKYDKTIFSSSNANFWPKIQQNHSIHIYNRTN